ncbi:ABC transporter permease [Erythrobacter litoralis]|uniref:ABC-type transport system permease component n=1 Tax=Erythrobacter litoralis (strain HTCC2594) TaxID=314225 RepID=Q2ND89_ERYLH|nr:ABC transporter permease [Erythrobacter litoralis]ABC62352.1 ABC-type transport system permease component [Erythrobacter litoralis HTCC2594]
MSEGASFSLQEQDDGTTVLRLAGPYLVSTIGPIDQDLRALEGGFSAVDLGDVSQIDTVGAWMACTVAGAHDAEIRNASDRASRLIDAVQGSINKAETTPERDPLFRRVAMMTGERVVEFGHNLLDLLSFAGAIVAGFGRLLLHPGRFPHKALFRQLELVGINALPIIGLMSFLIGIVIAQQGAVQLEQFGAETLTVNLVGRITMRELGVLMTAIMVAGRSGSAFAAQIGTMKLTEEVDAMRTIGISPVEALVLPRILAAVLMMPLLGFYSACVAIVGGAVVSEFALGIPFWNFLERIQDVVPTYDLWVGLIKAPVFGLIVALAGCYQGMQVRGNSEEVGSRTTKAVVQAIFMVIVLDAFFAVFFTEIGWG